MDLKLSQIEPEAQALRNEVEKDNPQYLELKGLIKKFGLQSPISVRRAVGPTGDELKNEAGEDLYRIVDGLHRWTAYGDLGMETIPVNVVTLEDSQLLAAQIAGNSGKIETTKAQYAQALKQVLQYGTMTESELAEKVGKSVTWIRNMLSLTKLPESIQKLVDESQIVVSNAIELAKLPAELLENFVQAAITESPTVFGPKVAQAVKEYRAAAREGRKVNTGFVAIATPRKPAEVKGLYATYKETGVNETLKKLVEDQGITDPVKAAVATLEWFLQLDPASVNTAKAKWEAEQAQKEAAKAAREADKEAKKAAAAKEAVAGVVQ